MTNTIWQHSLPTEAGTYVLWLRLSTAVTLQIGKIGTFTLADSWYAYIGSALGSGGLAGRLRHHLAPVHQPHWHIDYVRPQAIVTAIWYVRSPITYEHRWATIISALPSSSLPVPRFGASDCQCPAHFYALDAIPTLDTVSVLGAEVIVEQYQVSETSHTFKDG